MAPLAYERQLQQDPRWAMAESSRYFEGASQLQRTLDRLRNKLDELGIAYVVIHGMALGAHGCVRLVELKLASGTSGGPDGSSPITIGVTEARKVVSGSPR